MDRSTKSKKKKPQSSAGATGQGAGGHKGAGGHRGPSGQSHTNDLLSHLTPATDVGRGNIARHRTARLWTLLAEGVAKRDITKRFACKVNTLHTLWRHHR